MNNQLVTFPALVNADYTVLNTKVFEISRNVRSEKAKREVLSAVNDTFGK